MKILTVLLIALTVIAPNLVVFNSTSKNNIFEQVNSSYNFRGNLKNIEKQLWTNTVSVYLHDELWSEEDAYDAGHYLMVPLHAAFYLHNDEWQQEFSRHLARFMKALKENPKSVVSGRLNKLHYLYLASRFVALSEQCGKHDLIPQGLVELLYQEVDSIWLKEPAWQWDRIPFDGGMRERVLWKLGNEQVSKSYYRAIIDEELFIFAIAADLRAHERFEKLSETWSPVVSDILDTAYNVFRQEGKYQSEGGWLFQPGVWTDHPDYAYVGHLKKTPKMEPKPVPNIAWDTSHSHRFALWLSSLSNAYGEEQPEKDFYNKIKEGIGKQFFSEVLVAPSNDFPAYRTKNFMDGKNGVYRYNYLTTKDGYGPYELSGTITLGWWVFLGTEKIQRVYEDLSNSFPLPPEVISVYVGPNTTRKRNPFVSLPNSLNNGFTELIARLASKLPTH